MLDNPSNGSENWVEITLRRFNDSTYSVRSANFRREKYTNRITFKGGLPLEEALCPSLVREVLRMNDIVSSRSSVQEFPDFEMAEDGVLLQGASMLAGYAGEEYQQFLFRLNRVEGRVYAIFAPGLIQEDVAIGSPDRIMDLVRQKIVDPVNKLSSVFDGYDKETTFAMVPAYCSVLRRLMNTRLEKLERALRGNTQPLALENKSSSFADNKLAGTALKPGE